MSAFITVTRIKEYGGEYKVRATKNDVETDINLDLVRQMETRYYREDPNNPTPLAQYTTIFFVGGGEIAVRNPRWFIHSEIKRIEEERHEKRWEKS